MLSCAPSFTPFEIEYRSKSLRSYPLNYHFSVEELIPKVKSSRCSDKT
jgi:hypothetical protein